MAVAEENVLEGHHRLFEQFQEHRPGADLAQVLAIGFALGQADDLLLVELQELKTEQVDDGRAVIARLIVPAGLGQQVAVRGGHGEGQRFNACGATVRSDIRRQSLFPPARD